MIDFLRQPWPWYVAGPIIAIVYTLLLFFGKNFGISASLRAMCSAFGAGKKISFFRFDWKGQMWNLMFVLGAVIGGFIAAQWLSNNEPMGLSEKTKDNLMSYGLESWQTEITPTEIFDLQVMFDPRNLFMMVVGGFLIGFGSRYAGGCTSGHAISGLANLQLPSLVAVIGFFIGGLIMTWFLLPIILTW
jgi:uncharacterized membrane protein YedE/YeeE